MLDFDEEFLLLQEIYKAARAKLPPELWDYLIGGAESETTLKRNRQALDGIAFRPRVLRDVSSVDGSARLLGARLRIPVVLAPIGALQDFESGGGATSARAGAAFGIASMHSSVCEPELEAIASAASGPKIYQLYVREDSAWVDEQVGRAVAAGYWAFCITVDLDAYSCRERDVAKRYVTTTRRQGGGADDDFRARFCWDDVKRFKDQHSIPLMLKGIATAEDADIACEHGAEVVYVSNHGGRQLDHGRGTLAILPEVVSAVGGRAQIMVDGGVMRGTDVVKAIALGADAVGIGRLLGLGMAAAGEAGVLRVLAILEREIQTCLALLGVASFDELDASYLHPAEPVAPPTLTSPYPLLDEGY